MSDQDATPPDTLAAVRALLPAGPRPFVDLHSIGVWDLAEQIRAALAAASPVAATVTDVVKAVEADTEEES